MQQVGMEYEAPYNISDCNISCYANHNHPNHTLYLLQGSKIIVAFIQDLAEGLRLVQ